jgi:hypothetical protein
MVPELTAHIVWILPFAKATRSASLPSQPLVSNPVALGVMGASVPRAKKTTLRSWHGILQEGGLGRCSNNKRSDVQVISKQVLANRAGTGWTIKRNHGGVVAWF